MTEIKTHFFSSSCKKIFVKLVYPIKLTLLSYLLLNAVVMADTHSKIGTGVKPSALSLDISLGCVSGFGGWQTPPLSKDQEAECDRKNLQIFSEDLNTCLNVQTNTPEQAKMFPSYDRDKDRCLTCNDFNLWKKDAAALFAKSERSTDGSNGKVLGCNMSAAEADEHKNEKERNLQSLEFSEKLKRGRRLSQNGDDSDAVQVLQMAVAQAKKENMKSDLLLNALGQLEAAMQTLAMRGKEEYSEVETIIREQLIIQKQVEAQYPGKIPLGTLIFNGRLANNLTEQKKYNEAIELTKEILDVQEKANFPSSYFTRFDLALLVVKSGSLDNGVLLYDEAVTSLKKLLSQHPDVSKVQLPSITDKSEIFKKALLSEDPHFDLGRFDKISEQFIDNSTDQN